MSHPRRHILLALPLIAVLLALTLAIPHPMGATPVADFAAPMSLQEAQTRVRVAQQADTQRRDAIARTLGATSAASLPLVQNLFFSETSHHLSDRAGFLNFWRENGGGFVGKGCVGHSVSPGTVVFCGTARSVIGQIGFPVTRSNTYR